MPFTIVQGQVVITDEGGTPIGVLDDAGIRRLRTSTNIDKWIGSAAPTVGQKAMASSVPVTMAVDQDPMKVEFGVPGGGQALPKMVNLVYNKSDGAIFANSFKRVQTYTVPVGYSGYLIKFASYQAEAASSRCVAQTIMGSLSLVTNVFTAGTPYSEPQWACVVQAEVTSATQPGAGNSTITVGYTNELGTSGRTGTITIPRGSAIGTRWDLVLQTPDLGVRSIQSASVGATLTTGAIEILGLIQLAIHQDQSTTQQTETQFAPGAITFPTGTVLGVEYAGGTVSKQRAFDTLIQLIVTV